MTTRPIYANREEWIAATRRDADLAEWLSNLREFLDDQADAEYFTDSPSPVPNDAMRLLVELDRLFPALKESL